MQRLSLRHLELLESDGAFSRQGTVACMRNLAVDALGIVVHIPGEEVPLQDPATLRPVGWRRLRVGAAPVEDEEGVPDAGADEPEQEEMNPHASSDSEHPPRETRQEDREDLNAAVAAAEAGRREAEAALDAAMRRWVLEHDP